MNCSILEKLYDIKEEEYKKFSSSLISSKYEILGVRVPILRKLAKELNFSDINLSNSSTFEEVFLYGVTLSKIKDVNLLLEKLEEFLPFIDNWSICDMLVSSLKIIKKEKQLFYNFCEKLLKSGKTYYMRFAIVVFLTYFREKDEIEKILSLFPIVKDEYYFEMAVAWMNATYLIFHPDYVISKLNLETFSKFVVNKTISKANDSFRISKELKARLKKLRV